MENNCFWQGQCEYEQRTSYGTEVVKCMNTDCILWKDDTDRELGETDG